MVGTMQTQVMADFYEKVLQKPADMKEDNWYGWLIGNCFMSIGEHSEAPGMAKEPARIIINFETTDVKKEFDRIKALGATVVKEPYEMGSMHIATFADPDGNYFQLMTPWNEEK
ncbi:MAG: Glyoxalase-like domain protein [Microgenomates bacterium OLB23]|nr:MAG: Glyoxalase-like domain protein [Microgenomates bacterium OLB23]